MTRSVLQLGSEALTRGETLAGSSWPSPFLGHAGPGSTWQAAVVVAAAVLAACVVLAAAGRLQLDEPGDLLVPLATAAIVSSLGPLGHAWISDGIGWGIPLGAIALGALVLATLTPLELTPRAPLLWITVAVAAISIFTLYPPLTMALHPPPDVLPIRDDGEVTITSPADGTSVPAGEVDIRVEVTGASLGPVRSELIDLLPDPEVAGTLGVFVDGDRVDVHWDGCTVDQPCDHVEVTVPVEVGEREIAVEFLRGDGTPFSPTVIDRITVTAQPHEGTTTQG